MQCMKKTMMMMMVLEKKNFRDSPVNWSFYARKPNPRKPSHAEISKL